MNKKSLFYILFLFQIMYSFDLFSKMTIDVFGLPPGFSIKQYVSGINGIYYIDSSPEGYLFAGTRSGRVYVITPDRKKILLDDDLVWPTGVDYFYGDLYVVDIDKIYIYKDILRNLSRPQRTIYYQGLPRNKYNAWRYIRFGPEKFLYVGLGAHCNGCESNSPLFATIIKIPPGGGSLELQAEGVRYAGGFDWDLQTGLFWFNDNSRDGLGEDLPFDELNSVSAGYEHYGFPYLHGSAVVDPEFWTKRTHNNFSLPRYEFPAHTAPRGMSFYQGRNFPKKYQNALFVATFGSTRGERSEVRSGSVLVVLNERGSLSVEPFLNQLYSNLRFVDVINGSDGDLYVSEFTTGSIFKIIYNE